MRTALITMSLAIFLQTLTNATTVSISMGALLDAQGTSGTSYALQAGPDVNGTDWQTVDVKVANSEGSLEFVDPASGPHRFYRVVELKTVNINADWTGELKDSLAHYRLTGDLTRSGDPLKITGNNVILDLNGHTLTSNGAKIGIQAENVSGGLIFGGHLKNFTTSVSLAHTRNMTIKALTIVGVGITDVNAGISGVSSSRLRVSRCDVSNTHNPIWLTGVTESEVHHCLVHANDKGPMLRQGSSRNRIHHNVVRDNKNVYGILIVNDSNNNEVFSNVCTRNVVGIYLQTCDSNIIRDNLTNENLWGGIWVWEGSGNIIRNNTANRNGTADFVKFGILLGRPSAFGPPGFATNTLVENNTALDNHGNTPFKIDLFDNSLFDKKVCENTWRNNVFVVDNEAGADAGKDAGCIQ